MIIYIDCTHIILFDIFTIFFYIFIIFFLILIYLYVCLLLSFEYRQCYLPKPVHIWSLSLNNILIKTITKHNRKKNLNLLTFLTKYLWKSFSHFHFGFSLLFATLYGNKKMKFDDSTGHSLRTKSYFNTYNAWHIDFNDLFIDSFIS